MSIWARRAVVAGIALYVLSFDVCLLRGAPASPFRSYSLLGVGLTIQFACLVALSMLIISTTRYLEFLTEYFKGSATRSFAVLGPLIFLMFSAHMIALALYSRGSHRIENSRVVAEALSNCCLPGKLLSAPFDNAS
jgi:hypothetical protein